MSNGESNSQRKRSGYACRPCNLRRVKCDVSTIGIPCSRCRAAADSSKPCEVFESMRGKYQHKGNKVKIVEDAKGDPQKVPVQQQQTLTTAETHAPIVNIEHAPTYLPPNTGHLGFLQEPSGISHYDGTPTSDELLTASLLKNFASHTAEADNGKAPEGSSELQAPPPSSTNAVAAISRATEKQSDELATRFWEKFLDKDSEFIICVSEEDQIVCLGNSFPLSYYLGQYAKANKLEGPRANAAADLPRPTIMEHPHIPSSNDPGPNATIEDALTETKVVNQEQRDSWSQTQFDHLTRCGCFEVPSMEVQKALFEAYFECFHP